MRLRSQIDLKNDFKSDIKREAKGLLKIVLSLLSEKAFALLVDIIYKMFKRNRDVQVIDDEEFI